MPILLDKIPQPCRLIQANAVMTRTLVTLKSVDTVEAIQAALAGNNHHSFPVLNTKGVIIGTIPRNFVITIVKNKYFYK
jgi:predicted transcriptional regulator